MIKRTIILITIILCTVNLNPLIHVNDIREIFPDGPDNMIIENNIVAGSTHFLKSNAEASSLLSEVEKSANENFDFLLAEDHLKKAKDNMAISLIYFKNAIEVGKRIGYNEEKKVVFQTFNYDNFISTNNMIDQIAKKVKSYMIKNDVLGVYQENVNNLERIFDILVEIESQFEKKVKPDLTTFWRLYQAYVIPTFNSKGFPENKVTSKLIARKFERKNSIS